ncbi:MAG: hypothetical protein KF727_03400 [Microbacteriaceae bacterium]|nr:hypothetical protein [Microbacteriaceae bacterium]
MTTTDDPGRPADTVRAGAPDDGYRVLVRPRRSLLLTGFVSIALAMIPLFGVLYWFGAEHDSWIPVAIVHAVTIAAAVLVLVRQLSVFSAVTDDELIGRGIFSPLIRVPLSRIAAVDLVETYVGQAPDTATQLLVRDAGGGRLFRMRGNFYRPGDLQRIAAALPVPGRIATEPIPLGEFFRAYPGSAYWFENRPVLRVVVFVVALLVALGVGAWVMTILGMPIGFDA